MNPTMTLWIQLLAQLGLEVTYAIWKDWRDKTEPTQEMWDALLALSRKTVQQYLDESKP